MAKSYYSTVIDAPATAVWEVIRDFNHYTWAGVEAEVWSENDRTGTDVGNIRVVRTGEKDLRQRLTAYSESDRFYSYEFAAEPSLDVRRFEATLHVLPVVDGDRAFVEWYAVVDCDEAQEEAANVFFVNGCTRWLKALGDLVAN